MPMVPFLSPSIPLDRPSVMGPVTVAGVAVTVATRFPAHAGKLKPTQQNYQPMMLMVHHPAQDVHLAIMIASLHLTQLFGPATRHKHKSFKIADL